MTTTPNMPLSQFIAHASIVLLLLSALSYVVTSVVFALPAVFDPWYAVFWGCFAAVWLLLDNLTLAADLRACSYVVRTLMELAVQRDAARCVVSA